MKSDSNGSVSPYSPKPRTRLVSSRFMSPNSTASPEPGSGSPLGRFNRLARKDSTTLADHIGNERLKEREEHHQHQNKKPTNRTGSVFSALTKQRSCREFRNNTNCLEENDQDREVVGRTTKNGVSGKSPSPSPVVKKPSSYFDPARHSLDENTFKGSFICAQNSIDSESENTSLDSVPLERTLSSRKLGREVSSKYMAACGRRGEASDSDPLSFDDSWMMKKNITQKAVKKANSLIGYMSSKSQWALSPGRSGSPPLSLESKDKPLSFSSLKPPHKRVEKILSMGFDLFRTKKSFSTSEVIHQLRLLHNRLIQWRFTNARAHTVNHSMSLQAQSNLINVWDGLTKLRHSVMQKKIQVEREKLKMKLNFVLHSQMKLLETWGCMERQHLAAITTMRECLHYVVCKVPLLEGAKVDIPLVSIAQRYASDLTDSIVSVLSSFSPLAYKTSELISKLARIVAEEKLLLQEFNDVFHDICVLELKERSLVCSLIQLEC
ncbi:QWRF motif-containing protein [Vigna angularis]|uniref:QWRF motif-containing protein n=2 Tax=Phaseolus angularis TaxID=3914 RepID=A0A8T0KFJ9_PHAAN|nr:QWRF motif-containing protein 3-like [Vigna angularis]KAG2397243.1 QWRF motif-containing protein [Vigna angularis]